MTSALDKFFLPYQKRWILDKSRKRLIEKSRQIGISLSTAYDLVKKTSVRDNQFDAWVSSRDDLQAQLFAVDCSNWVRIVDATVKAAPNISLEVLDPKEKISAHVLPFKNGRSIYSLSSNPNAQAGKRGRRVFDEFALNEQNRMLYSIGQPGTMWGGGMDIISTHRGTANFFNELVIEAKHKGNPKGFSLHTVTILDAVKDGLLEKLKSKWGKADPGDDRLKWTDDDFLRHMRNECADEETWLQEFMCIPGDDNAAFLPYDLIASCEYKPEEAWEYLDREKILGDLFVGVDIGRDHDLTVIWALEKLGSVFYTRKLICLQKAPFAEQEDALYPLLEHPRLRRCCIDQNGIGRQFTERARARFKHRVEGIKFTNQSKEEMAYPLKAAFEDKTVRIPNEKLVRADLRNIRKQATAGGNTRFAGERNANGHSDRFWALALALLAGKSPTDGAITSTAGIIIGNRPGIRALFTPRLLLPLRRPS